MSKMISDLVSNKIQILLVEGVKSYITLARLLRQVGTSLIVLQLFFMGVQIGLFMLILPILFPGSHGSLGLGLSLIGGLVVLACAGSLYFWNSERAWTQRLHIRSVIEALKDFDQHSK